MSRNVQGDVLLHSSPPITSASLSALNSALTVPMDGQSDVLFTFGGAYGGATIAFEWSADSTDGTNGIWWPLAVRPVQGVDAPIITRALAANEAVALWGSAPFATYARARVAVAPPSGAVAVSGTGSSATRMADIYVDGGPVPVSGSGRLSQALLAASGVYTAPTVDRGPEVTSTDTRVRPVVRHLAGLTHGHLILQESVDNTNWLETRRVPVPSDGQYHSFDWAVHLRYWRLVFANGAVAQTGFDLLQQSGRGDGSSVDVRNVLPFVIRAGAVAVSETVASATFDLGSNHDWSLARLWTTAAEGPVTYTAIAFSDDGSYWRSVSADDKSVATGQGVMVESRIPTRYVRFQMGNGSTAQSNMRMVAALVSL